MTTERQGINQSRHSERSVLETSGRCMLGPQNNTVDVCWVHRTTQWMYVGSTEQHSGCMLGPQNNTVDVCWVHRTTQWMYVGSTEQHSGCMLGPQNNTVDVCWVHRTTQWMYVGSTKQHSGSSVFILAVLHSVGFVDKRRSKTDEMWREGRIDKCVIRWHGPMNVETTHADVSEKL
ncbi:hypothetical protein BaRGS_00029479 [Batillaria attramentaria]|uniref:Uncharacterized protein n=1 Tax=Batillaria attramentaria TaxID=370345 RepID=A0ABD0JX75_9CAEN